MPTTAELNAKFDKLEVNMDRFDPIINGDDTTEVTTDSGLVPSWAKAVKDLTDTAITNLETIVRDINNKFAVDITDPQFGAVGDNVTDNTVAIQDAIDFAVTLGGGRVIVPTGNYVITDTIYIPKGITLTGFGETSQWNHGATIIIKLNGGTTVYPAFVGEGSTRLSNLGFNYPEQAWDSGNSQPLYSWPAVFTIETSPSTPYTSMLVDRCYFHNASYAIDATAKHESLHFIDCDGYCIEGVVKLDRSYDTNIFSNLRFNHNEWYVTQPVHTDRDNMIKWTFDNAWGLDIQRADGTIIQNCLLYGYAAGIRFSASSTDNGGEPDGVAVMGCFFDGCKEQVRVEAGINLQIATDRGTGNSALFTGSASVHGIVVYGCKTLHVSGGSLWGLDQNALTLQPSNTGVVTFNGLHVSDWGKITAGNAIGCYGGTLIASGVYINNRNSAHIDGNAANNAIVVGAGAVSCIINGLELQKISTTNIILEGKASITGVKRIDCTGQLYARNPSVTSFRITTVDEGEYINSDLRIDGVTAGDITNNSAHLLTTEAAVKLYADSLITVGNYVENNQDNVIFGTPGTSIGVLSLAGGTTSSTDGGQLNIGIAPDYGGGDVSLDTYENSLRFTTVGGVYNLNFNLTGAGPQMKFNSLLNRGMIFPYVTTANFTAHDLGEMIYETALGVPAWWGGSQLFHMASQEWVGSVFITEAQADINYVSNNQATITAGTAQNTIGVLEAGSDITGSPEGGKLRLHAATDYAGTVSSVTLDFYENYLRMFGSDLGANYKFGLTSDVPALSFGGTNHRSILPTVLTTAQIAAVASSCENGEIFQDLNQNVLVAIRNGAPDIIANQSYIFDNYITRAEVETQYVNEFQQSTVLGTPESVSASLILSANGAGSPQGGALSLQVATDFKSPAAFMQIDAYQRILRLVSTDSSLLAGYDIASGTPLYTLTGNKKRGAVIAPVTTAQAALFSAAGEEGYDTTLNSKVIYDGAQIQVFATHEHVAANYLNTTDAASTYLSITNAASTYLSIANAATEYVAQNDPLIEAGESGTLGEIYVYGDSTGSLEGGKIRLYKADDYTGFWNMDAYDANKFRLFSGSLLTVALSDTTDAPVFDITGTVLGTSRPWMTLTATQRNALPAGSLVPGAIIWNSTSNELNFYNGTAWREISSGAA